MSNEELHELEKRLCPECFKELLRELGGTRPYIPVETTAVKAARNAVIRKNFNGQNHAALAREFGLSPRHVRRILGATS